MWHQNHSCRIQNKQTLQRVRPTRTCPWAEQFDAGDEVKENNSIRMEITGDTTVLGFALHWAWQLGLHSFILMYLLGNALNLKSQNLERVSAVPQKNPGTNAVCASNLVFLFFNSFNTINMGEGESCLHDCLSSPPVPSLKKKKKASLKSLFNFGCSDQWLVTVMTRWREWRALCQAERTVSVWVICACASWVADTTEGRRSVRAWGDSGFSPEPGVAECSHSLPFPRVSGSQLLPQTEI